MSEQLGSVGGGDVLSSIRRLVAEEKLPKRRAIRFASVKAVAEPEAVEAAAETATEKLLLTPALRVEQPVPAAKPARGKALTKAEAVKPVDKAVDRGEPKPKAPRNKAAKVVPLASVAPKAEPKAVDIQPAETAQDLAPVAEAPRDPMEAVIAALAQAALEKQALQKPAAVEPTPEPQPSTAVVVELSERRAERDEAPKIVEPAAEPMPDLTAEDESPVLGMDPDALRDLVRDVLREELQGEFGERITRNVRKLVRAEIARALMSRGIE